MTLYFLLKSSYIVFKGKGMGDGEGVEGVEWKGKLYVIFILISLFSSVYINFKLNSHKSLLS